MSQQAFGFVDSGNPLELLSADGWQTTGSVDISNGVITGDPGEPSASVFQPLRVDLQNTNQPLYLTIVVDSMTEGAIEAGQQVTAAGTYVFAYPEPGTDFTILLSFTDAVISSVSLKLLTDAQLGPELVTNGDFSSGSGWVNTPDGVDDAWVIAGGVASVTDVDIGGYITNTGATLEVNALYRFSIDVIDLPEGFQLGIGVDDSGSFGDSGANELGTEGTSVQYFGGASTLDLAIYGGYGLHQIDNVSLKKYTLPA